MVPDVTLPLHNWFTPGINVCSFGLLSWGHLMVDRYIAKADIWHFSSIGISVWLMCSRRDFYFDGADNSST